jgi:hypothetical protein
MHAVWENWVQSPDDGLWLYADIYKDGDWDPSDTIESRVNLPFIDEDKNCPAADAGGAYKVATFQLKKDASGDFVAESEWEVVSSAVRPLDSVAHGCVQF